MRRIVDIIPARQAIEGDAADSVRLDHDLRNRRRMVFTTVAGDSVLLDMPRPVHLRGGDRLQLEDGALIRVEAMDEALTEISASSTAALVRIAWHLGNRHLPTQLMPGDTGGTLRIRHDHVIEDMVAGLGGTCALLMAPFDPEGGAYAGEEGDPALSGHHHHHHDHAHG
jgi:urease accessory protein